MYCVPTRHHALQISLRFIQVNASEYSKLFFFIRCSQIIFDPSYEATHCYALSNRCTYAFALCMSAMILRIINKHPHNNKLSNLCEYQCWLFRYLCTLSLFHRLHDHIRCIYVRYCSYVFRKRPKNHRLL